MKTIRLMFLLALVLIAHATARAADTRFFRIEGPVPSRITSFTASGNLTWTNVATNATFTIQAAFTLVGPSNWVTYLQVPASNRTTTASIYSTNSASGMALIVAGPFTMGDNLDGEGVALPLHTNTLSSFNMDQYDVTKSLWDTVYQWATTNGYSFDHPGSGKAANHPVQTISWFDAVKWCNARSEREGRTPAYYTDAGQTNVYRTGQLNLNNSWVNWNAGYRLPTEAEWEKAARGGLAGQRFPWGADISWSHANYYAYTGFYSYETNSISGFDPGFNDGTTPFTSPVDYFAPNGYGLYDMSGNVFQWCWDWYGAYSSAPQTDPRGPASGPGRMSRGGGYDLDASSARVADRYDYNPPDTGFDDQGFRCVRAPGP